MNKNLYCDIMGQLSNEFGGCKQAIQEIPNNIQDVSPSESNGDQSMAITFIQKYSTSGKCTNAEKQDFFRFLDEQPLEDIDFLINNVKELVPNGNPKYIKSLQILIKNKYLTSPSKQISVENLPQISSPQMSSIEQKLSELIQEVRNLKQNDIQYKPFNKDAKYF